MGIVTDVISAVSAWIAGVFDWLVDAVEGVVTIFYDSDGLTIVGVLLLFGLAMSLVFFAFRFIRGLIRK